MLGEQLDCSNPAKYEHTNFVDAVFVSSVFYSLDLRESSYQLKLPSSSVHTGIMRSPIGFFAYILLAMDIKNLQACISKFVNDVLRGLNFVFLHQ